MTNNCPCYIKNNVCIIFEIIAFFFNGQTNEQISDIYEIKKPRDSRGDCNEGTYKVIYFATTIFY